MVATLKNRIGRIELTPEQLAALNLPPDWKERIPEEYYDLMARLIEENAHALEELKKY